MEEDEHAEQTLDQFRENWRKEIQENQGDSDKNKLNFIIFRIFNLFIGESSNCDAVNQEMLAKSYFLKAVELERTKKYFEAVRFYKVKNQIFMRKK
jgi:hypothetical protein